MSDRPIPRMQPRRRKDSGSIPISPRLARPIEHLQTMRTIAGDEGWSVARSRAIGAAKRRVRSGLSAAPMRLMNRAISPRHANLVFWKGPGQEPRWPTVRARAEWLHEFHCDELDRFVSMSLELTDDPMIVVGLAQHPLTRDSVRTWMVDALADDLTPLFERSIARRLLGAAFVGAAKLLLDADTSDLVALSVEDWYQIPDDRFYQFVDSLGMSLVSESVPMATQPRRPCRSRLVIVENVEDAESVALLLPDADTTTVLATSDTFGRADLSKYEAWPGVGDVTVEHIRSRISRFSQHYIDLHEATARLAVRVVDEVCSMEGLLSEDVRSHLELSVADAIFFQALRIRAVEELLADRTIDQIVVAFGDTRRSHSYRRLISSVGGLLEDERVELLSLSTSAEERARFWNLIDQLCAPALPERHRPYARVPEPLVVRKLEQDAVRLAAALQPTEHEDEAEHLRSVLVVTSGTVAYNESTAGYVDSLRSDFETRVLCVGGSAAALRNALDGSAPVSFLAPFGARFKPLVDALAPRLRALGAERPTNLAEAATLRACRDSASQIILNAIGPTVLTAKTLHHWMQVAQSNGELPDAIVLTPQRTAGIGVTAPVARRFGVPTLAVEPHGQDANYSRYIKVGADYHGVMCEYFRTRTAASFGISLERTRTVGSPRLVVPVDYDPIDEQIFARREYSGLTGLMFVPGTTYLVFFCQPTAWQHVSRIWEIILRSAAENECVVLLKTHPEESISRRQQYLNRAAALGVSDIVVELETDAATAIALGDVVLTAFSTGAIDATIRQTPVVCVTDRNVRYPVDLPAILDVPLARSTEELSEIITEFRARPDEFVARARALLEREPHFVDGTGPGLRQFVNDIIDAGSAGVRDVEVLPGSLFLDGPHPTFRV